MPSAIPVSESQYLKIAAASQWLCPSDRAEFWAMIAAELHGQELGDGSVTRAIGVAFRQFYKPLQLSEPRSRYRAAG